MRFETINTETNITMKHILSSFLTLLIVATPFAAQAQANLSSTAPEGTSLGANETIDYNGIALGNRVKLRGYVDFIFSHTDDNSTDNTDFSTAADIDFLFDFSPVTGEIHLAADDEGVDLEQAFARYSFNQDINLSFGRQLTNLGFEGDEAPDLYAVTNAYYYQDYNGSGTAQLRRNYVDGIRFNFNNGQFGLSIGLHDDYFGVDDALNDNVAIDLAASVMIIPGLEARLGYAHQDRDHSAENDIDQLNAWIAFNPGDLTLALEYDLFDIYGDDLWNLMFLANYQFVDWFGATFRYSHEDIDHHGGGDSDADRFTLAFLFSLTDNLFLNFEYSHTEVDTTGGDYDVDEIYIEGLFTF